MAKPSPQSARPARLLVLELWGLGDLALAIPFLRGASVNHAVSLVAKPAAAPLLQRFAPAVEHLPFVAPWTAFTGKYRLHRWPWREMAALRRALRDHAFDTAVSARPDPRDALLLRLAGAPRRVGFPRAGSGPLLTTRLPAPERPHRTAHWEKIAATLGFTPERPHPLRPAGGRRILIHTGAGHRVREWPRGRFDEVARRLRAAGWLVTIVDDATTPTLDQLVDVLESADRFIGNDSGPGHVASLLGIPTFTIFGPQRPELFAPTHPDAGWIEGGPCPYKPCFDACRFAEPHCLLANDVERVWAALTAWLQRVPTPGVPA